MIPHPIDDNSGVGVFIFTVKNKLISHSKEKKGVLIF
jgi:hypothetical protein